MMSRDSDRSFLFGCLMSAAALFPAGLKFGLDYEAYHRLIVCFQFDSLEELRILVVAWATMFGGWFGATVIPLDADRPWQVWPVSCVYGILICNLVGYPLAYICNIFQKKLKVV
eukprot:TRINITY_DN3255_c0_g1_i2.p1 TRINITY_DN3255_c0_g1~~TRINITY_DN3255_c0_g1_i2.p1  ORF type:complete len:114 (+),score=12.78 TRINITY_DN3255_c0_g1_i2:215-556(+)